MTVKAIFISFPGIVPQAWNPWKSNKHSWGIQQKDKKKNLICQSTPYRVPLCGIWARQCVQIYEHYNISKCSILSLLELAVKEVFGALKSKYLKHERPLDLSVYSYLSPLPLSLNTQAILLNRWTSSYLVTVNSKA